MINCGGYVVQAAETETENIMIYQVAFEQSGHGRVATDHADTHYIEGEQVNVKLETDVGWQLEKVEVRTERFFRKYPFEPTYHILALQPKAPFRIGHTWFVLSS